MGTGREPANSTLFGLIPRVQWMVAWKSGMETGRLDDGFAQFVRLADHAAGLQAAAGQHAAERFGVMSASAAAVELWRPSEFGGNDHERGVEQLRAFQILEQRGEGLIEILNQQVLL